LPQKAPQPRLQDGVRELDFEGYHFPKRCWNTPGRTLFPSLIKKAPRSARRGRFLDGKVASQKASNRDLFDTRMQERLVPRRFW